MTDRILFNRNPEIQYPIASQDGGPTVTGAIHDINTAVGRQLGTLPDSPYIIDGIQFQEESLPDRLINQVMSLENKDGSETLQILPNGAVCLLIRHMGNNIIPVYGVKLRSDGPDTHFAVAGLVSDKDQKAAYSLSTAAHMNIPEHLSPRSEDPNTYSNVALILGDAYHRVNSLLADQPNTQGGHNALDGQHNPGLHHLLVAALQSKKIADAGELLHGLHDLDSSQNPFDSLREYFKHLSNERPMAPVSLITVNPGNNDKTSIAFNPLLLNPDGSFLNIAQIAPISSVISEFITTDTRPVNPDQALYALENAAGGDLGNIL